MVLSALGAFAPSIVKGVGSLLGGGGGNAQGQSQTQQNTLQSLLQNVMTNTQGQQTGQQTNQQFGQTMQGPGQFTSGFFQNGLDFLGQAFNSAPQASYQGPINANVNQTQIAGNNAATQLGSSYLGQGEQTRALANQTLSGDFLNPQSNPYLGNVLSQLAVPTVRAFTEDFMPAATSQAIASGAYGGSRNGVTNALGIDRFTENLTNTIGAQLFDNYQTERDRQFQAPGLLQQAFGLEQGAVDTLRSAGSEQQGFAQQEIDEYRTLDSLARTQPFDLVDRLFGSLGQVGDRSSFTSGFNDGTNNSLSNQQQQAQTSSTTQTQQQGTSTLSPAALADLQSQTFGRDARTDAQGLANKQTQQILDSMPFQNQIIINNQAKTLFPELYNQNPTQAIQQYLDRIQSTPVPFQAFTP